MEFFELFETTEQNILTGLLLFVSLDSEKHNIDYSQFASLSAVRGKGQVTNYNLYGTTRIDKIIIFKSLEISEIGVVNDADVLRHFFQRIVH